LEARIFVSRATFVRVGSLSFGGIRTNEINLESVILVALSIQTFSGFSSSGEVGIFNENGHALFGG
jgi:hypothetical protein